MRILAIDPGYERLGIAVLEKKGRKEVLVHSECFKTSPKIPHSERLFLIGDTIRKIIETYGPEVLAIETLFMATNQKTAMFVSEARGVVLYEAARNKLKVFEYTPLQIKVAVTSYGRSDKSQVMSMVPRLISIDKPIKHDDEYDAIAVGLTFFACERLANEKTAI